jgi:glycosyltransferase involved in cell wall biosynthesis
MLEAYMRKYLLRPLKLANHFIFVSQFAQSKHLEFDPRYALKSSHLYNMNIPVHENPINKGTYFLYYGRLSREKGLLTLIDAAKTAGIKLIIAGTGPQEEEIKRLRDFKTISPGEEEIKMECVGFKSGTELESLIRGCSFVIVPSEWYENNPMSVIESYALGKPVIGSRIGGIPELVTPDNGFLFDPGNPECLADVLRKAENIPLEDYTKMSIACREFASKNFDRSLHFEGLSRIYHQVSKLA